MAKKSSFIISVYYPGQDSELTVELPNCCPEGAEEGKGCKTTLHSWRGRKTGPCHALAIIHCKTHKRYFTIYPPGHVKYGRKPLVDISPDGKLYPAGLEKFRNTKFLAALDAAEGIAWDREAYSTSGKWWQTQCRYIDDCSRLLGIHPEITDKAQEFVSQFLDVPQLLLRETRASITASPGYRTRGKGIVAILKKLTEICLVERLTLTGHLTGLWGCPFWWKAKTRELTPAPFQRPGTFLGGLRHRESIASMNSRQ